MSKILVVYGTTTGHTVKIAAALEETLRAEGCEVTVANASGPAAAVAPDAYDGVIVAASVHVGGYQRGVKRWVRRHAAALNARPTAFLSVCLGVLEQNPETQREVLAIMDRFLDRAGWHPAVQQPVAGALPYTRYGWLTRWMMRRIVAKAGGDTDTSRDYEYTDWEALRVFAHSFAERVAAAHATAPAAARS